MKREFLFRAIGDIDNGLIAEAEADSPRRGYRGYRRIGAIAACFLCAVGVIIAVPRLLSDHFVENDAALDTRVEYGDTFHAIADAEQNEQSPTENTWLFWFYEEGEWRTEARAYPSGVPTLDAVLNDYLTAVGEKARCVMVQEDEQGGVRTLVISLNADVAETVLYGLANTALQSGTAHAADQVQITQPGGTFGPWGALYVN